jgi:proteasome lid subunit RPN8/RPN11
MALREDQILRYSRQILLKDVGGRGQEALLAGGAHLEASGASGLTAAAYLAAGGTAAVAAVAVPLAPGAAGFLVSAGEVGRPASEVLEPALRELNPDALPPRGSGMLAELPVAEWSGEGPWVALGGEGARAVVAFRSTKGCADCFRATVATLGAPPQGALGMGLGALGALAFQRLLLNLGPELGACAWSLPEGLTPLEPRRCSRCELARTAPELPGDLSGILRHLESTYPREGCGVLLRAGTSGPWRLRIMRNAYDDLHALDPGAWPRTSHTAYAFDPREWLDVLREADSRGERVMCVFHSHVDEKACFSAEDRRWAAPEGHPLIPEAAWLVVSVYAGQTREATLSWWHESGFKEIPVSLDA